MHVSRHQSQSWRARYGDLGLAILVSQDVASLQDILATMDPAAIATAADLMEAADTVYSMSTAFHAAWLRR